MDFDERFCADHDTSQEEASQQPHQPSHHGGKDCLPGLLSGTQCQVSHCIVFMTAHMNWNLTSCCMQDLQAVSECCCRIQGSLGGMSHRRGPSLLSFQRSASRELEQRRLSRCWQLAPLDSCCWCHDWKGNDCSWLVVTLFDFVRLFVGLSVTWCDFELT